MQQQKNLALNKNKIYNNDILSFWDEMIKQKLSNRKYIIYKNPKM